MPAARPESVRDGVDGFLVADDPEDMARRALELLADPALHRRMVDEAKRGAAGRLRKRSAGGSSPFMRS